MNEYLIRNEVIDQYFAETRRLLVPMGITFKKLHQIIQIAFDWQNSHLHDFNLFDEKEKCILKIARISKPSSAAFAKAKAVLRHRKSSRPDVSTSQSQING